MAARASWKGYLKLSLVSCAVQLYPASTSKERVSFHMLNRETGHRLKRQMVDAETGEPVESESQIKGYEIGNAATSKSRTRRSRVSRWNPRTRSTSTPSSHGTR